jgi:hypothetical protein
MFSRRHLDAPAHDPLVVDRHGRVVGVSTSPPEAPAETKASRAWYRRRNLATTGELRFQAALRNQFAAFHIDPATLPKR